MDQLLSKFKETESKYNELKARLGRGEITQEDAKAEIKRLMIPDETGTYWMMGGKSGRWYKHVDGQWVEANPFDELAPPAPEPEPTFQPQVQEQSEPVVSKAASYDAQEQSGVHIDLGQKVEQLGREDQVDQGEALDLGGFGGEEDASNQQQSMEVESGRVEESDEVLFSQSQEQASAVESHSYSFEDKGSDAGIGFSSTDQQTNVVDTNQFKLDSVEGFGAESESSDGVGINIDLEKEEAALDIGGFESAGGYSDVGGLVDSGEYGGVVNPEGYDNSASPGAGIGFDDAGGLAATGDFGDSDGLATDDSLEDSSEEKNPFLDTGQIPVMDQDSHEDAITQNPLSQDTFSTKPQDPSFAARMSEASYGEIPQEPDISSISQGVQESNQTPMPEVSQAVAPQHPTIAEGIPAVDFSQHINCVACNSKIPPIAVYCTFCGADQKELDPKKRKKAQQKKISKGMENELVFKSIQVMSFLFFLGGLGIILGVIFGGTFGVLKNILKEVHYQLPVMLQEVRGGFVGGLIFAAIGGIGGFVGFAFLSLIISGFYNLIAFVFGGIRFKVKG
jgi:ribosomal protein L40E